MFRAVIVATVVVVVLGHFAVRRLPENPSDDWREAYTTGVYCGMMIIPTVLIMAVLTVIALFCLTGVITNETINRHW